MRPVYINIVATRHTRPQGVAHLDIRLADQSLTAHLPPQPILSTLATLVAGLDDLLRGRCDRAVIPLGLTGHQLRLERGVRGLSLSLTASDAFIVDRCRVAAAQLREVLCAAGDQALAAEATACTTTPRRSLREALARLQAAPRDEHKPSEPTRVELSAAPQSTSPSLAFWSTARGCQARLGELVVALPDARAGDLAVALADGIEACLEGRDWPAGRHYSTINAALSLLIDRASTSASTRDTRLKLTILRHEEICLAGPYSTTVTALGSALHQLLRGVPLHRLGSPTARTQLHRVQRRASRLIAWARALAQPDIIGTGHPTAAADRGLGPQEQPPQEQPRLEGVFHLAWRRRWRVEVPELSSAKAFESLIVAFGGGRCQGVSREDGAIRWDTAGWTPVRGHHLLVTDRKRRLAELSTIDGRPLWRSGSLPEEVCYHEAVVDERTVLVSASDGALIALDRAAGRRLWSRPTHHGEHVVFARGGGGVWICGQDGLAALLDTQTGTLRARVRLNGHPVFGPKALAEGLLIGSQADLSGRYWLTLLTAHTGALIWRRAFRVRCSPRPAAALGRCALIVETDSDTSTGAATGAQLVLIELGSGDTLWSQSLPPGWADARLALNSGLVLLKRLDGAVDAYDDADGTLRWRLPAEDRHRSLITNAAILSHRGMLLVPAAHVRAVDPRDGRVLHTLDCQELRPSLIGAGAAGGGLDLVLAEDHAVARYALEGHLAMVGG